jgi:hypothetical protein
VATSASLSDAQVRGIERARLGAEQVQRADHLIPQPHRQCLNAAESGQHGSGRKPRPPLGRLAQLAGRLGRIESLLRAAR